MAMITDSLRIEQALCKLETGSEVAGRFYNLGAGAIEGIFKENIESEDAAKAFADFLWKVLEEKE